MKVSKLIAILQKMPQDAIVVQSGYETGYNDIGRPRLNRMYIYSRKEWRDGKYRKEKEIGQKPIQVVNLGDRNM